MLPSHIDVAGRRYELRTDPETARQLRDRGSRGETYGDRARIELDPDVPLSLLRETVLHELLHAAWDCTALRIEPGLVGAEERIVTSLAPIVLDALRRNPQLVALLFGEEQTSETERGA